MHYSQLFVGAVVEYPRLLPIVFRWPTTQPFHGLSTQVWRNTLLDRRAVEEEEVSVGARTKALSVILPFPNPNLYVLSSEM